MLKIKHNRTHLDELSGYQKRLLKLSLVFKNFRTLNLLVLLSFSLLDNIFSVSLILFVYIFIYL